MIEIKGRDVIPSALLRVVGRNLQRNLTGPLLKVAGGELSVEDAAKQALASFIQSHANAVYCGRLAAGDNAPIGDADRASVQLLAQEQQQFFERFAGQLADGKYRNDAGELNTSAIEDRAGLYSMRLRGTANDGWANALDADELIHWRLGGTENHCSICPDLAERGPYKPGELPTTPGANETPCLWNCACELESESGTSPPKSFVVALKFSPEFLQKHGAHGAMCSCKKPLFPLS